MSAIETGLAPVNKPLVTLQARAALAGFTCCETAAGNFVLSRSGGSWIFATVEIAAAWLDRQWGIK